MTKQDITHEQKREFFEASHAGTLMETLGIRVDSYDPDAVTVAVEVDQKLFQPTGIVHGGVYVVLAETAASIATALSIDLTKERGFGMEINANHLRPVSKGTLRATATPVHRGRTTHVYNIRVVDQDDRLVCFSRCTMAVRELPKEGT